ncbi:hypothetical protein BDD12DRAFT_32002 [Trichophaea hybrida]|nr:hypothetical protein BDD12DRAFT_32002 [Trichophaea hybrida]
MPPCYHALFKYWILSYTPAAFIIVFLCLKYLPWLFAPVRRYPWVDLTSIYNDPSNYQSTVEKISGWKMITLFIIHQIIICLITIWMFTSKYFNDIAPEEPETTALVNLDRLLQSRSWGLRQAKSCCGIRCQLVVPVCERFARKSSTCPAAGIPC